jgi:hypothetical protein
MAIVAVKMLALELLFGYKFWRCVNCLFWKDTNSGVTSVSSFEIIYLIVEPKFRKYQ